MHFYILHKLGPFLEVVCFLTPRDKAILQAAHTKPFHPLW